MTSLTLNSTALLLLLLLALLPLTASASAAHAGVNEVGGTVSADTLHTECATSDHATCDQLQSEKGNHDDCCKNHCNSSFGAQISTEHLLTPDIPHANIYALEDAPWVPTPEPKFLLRPPLYLA